MVEPSNETLAREVSRAKVAMLMGGVDTGKTTLALQAARLAVEARYLSGDRGAAIARFSEYRAVLAREAGCEPSRTSK